MPSERPTILVVDDTPANLSVLLDLLTGAGFAVLVAEPPAFSRASAGAASPKRRDVDTTVG